MPHNSPDLVYACLRGDFPHVRELVEAGADVNSREDNGIGPLLTFHPEITSYLLEKGAQPDTQCNEFGASVLAGLSYVNKVDCVRVLLEHGANPNHGRIESGETPLHHALANGIDLALVKLLVDHGADVNAKTTPGVSSYNYWGLVTRGESPLHRAAAWASVDVVQLLITGGAELGQRDSRGEAPWDWAGWHWRDRAIIDLLALEKN